MMMPPLSEPAIDGQQTEATQHYQRVLHELIDIGVGLVRQLAEAQAPGAIAAAEVAVAYERITRSIRRSIGLAQRLEEGTPAQAKAPIAARRRIIRDVEDVIQREACGSEADELRAELRERMDGPDVADDIDSRPAAEIITDICRDLGLGAMPDTQPWQRRTPDDIATLYARAAGVWDATAAMPGAAVPGMVRPPGSGTGIGPP